MSFDLKIKNGDLQIGSNGDLQQVRDTEKLEQDILKIITTPLGANLFFPWYGSSVSNSLIGNALSFQFTSNMANTQIQQALQTLQQWQNNQISSGQSVTAAEMIAAVQQVKVERNQTDPRYFRIAIKVLTKALTPLSTSMEVGL